jgi:hypothetical protein
MKRVYRSNDMVYDNMVAREYLLEKKNGQEETDSDLPTNDVPVGSEAYNATLTSMYMFDGTEWQKIIGGE